MISFEEYVLEYLTNYCVDKGIDYNDPNELIRVAEELDKKGITSSILQDYEEYVKANKIREEEQKEWDDFWKKQEGIRSRSG